VLPSVSPAAGETGVIGAEAGEAAAGTTVASEATAGAGGIRSIMGAAMMGIGAKGLAGAGPGIGGGISEALGLGTAAADIFDPIAAIGGIYEGLNQFAAQRSQGAFYQGILGGSNLAGQGQRFLQAGFRLSQLGNLTGAQANALFQGVTQLDMTGGERQNAMQQAVQMYDQLGVSIQSSLQLITIAAQSGNKALTGLTEAIQGVTQAAVEGGVNANVARQGLANTYQGLVASGVQGGAAAQVAGGLQSAVSRLGPLFQNLNLSSLFNNPQNLMMLASQLPGPGGQPMGADQFLGGLMSGNPQWAGQAITAEMQRFLPTSQLSPLIGTAAQAMGIQQARNAQGKLMFNAQGQPEWKISQAQVQGLTSRVLTESATTDPEMGYQLMAVLQGLGYNVNDPTTATELAIAGLTGAFAPSTAGPNMAATRFRVQAPPKPIPLTRPGQRSTLTQADITRLEAQSPELRAQASRIRQTVSQQIATRLGPSTLRTISEQQLNDMIQAQAAPLIAAAAEAPSIQNQYPAEYQKYLQNLPQYKAAAQAIGLPSGMSRGWENLFGASPSEAAKNYYMKNVVSRGQRDPVMEKLLSDPALNNAQTVFSVNLGGGQTQLATAQQLETHYMAQVQSGNVTIAAAQNPQLAGQSLAQYMNFTPTNQGAVAGAGWASSAQGKAAQAALQKQVTGEQKNIVTVVPSQALLQWMQFNGQGNVQVQNDTATATNQTAPGYTLPALST
jgi:hypothetical protein